MSSQDPLENLFDEMGDLIRFLDKNIKRIPSDDELSDDIKRKLTSLEVKVMMLSKLSDQIVAASGISREEMRMRMMGRSGSLTEESKALVSHADTLRDTVEDIKHKHNELQDTGISYTPPGTVELPEKRSPTEKPAEGKKRKNKFRRLGGDDKWKPL
jgi:hypothetical protein